MLIPTVIVFRVFFILCVWLVVRAQKRPVTTGLGALVGETGRLLQGIENPDLPGKVVCHGEIWDAQADLPVAADSQVRVIAVEGRILRVVLVSQANQPVANQRS